MKTDSKKASPVIAIGSGNVETILEHDGEIQPGRKHIVNTHELVGGSCVNYSMRLITAGNTVFPIPFIGDDRFGEDIRKALLDIGRRNKISKKALTFIDSKTFLIPDVQTPKAIIVVHRGKRTIFSQGLTGITVSEKHIQKRLDLLNDLVAGDTGSVMIGHITVDSDTRKPGRISRKIIDAYWNSHLIFANFGNSQLNHGVEFWKEDLCRIDLFQLNLDEIRRLFKKGNQVLSLSKILKWLRKHSITAVITLNRFGAIGTYKDGKEGIVLAWPLNIGKIVDPTGAGDAFASGMVSTLRGKKDFSFDDFLSAIAVGRTWASYACTTLGASSGCPDQEMLDAYQKQHAGSHNGRMEVTTAGYVEQIMDLIDKAY
ncbi:MAG: carbohydrate kinase family protein [Desulfobacterales bacterium]